MHQVIPYKRELILIFILCFSCIFKPGMNAILGPTGSGKSSYVSLGFSILVNYINQVTYFYLLWSVKTNTPVLPYIHMMQYFEYHSELPLILFINASLMIGFCRHILQGVFCFKFNVFIQSYLCKIIVGNTCAKAFVQHTIQNYLGIFLLIQNFSGKKSLHVQVNFRLI